MKTRLSTRLGAAYGLLSPVFLLLILIAAFGAGYNEPANPQQFPIWYAAIAITYPGSLLPLAANALLGDFRSNALGIHVLLFFGTIVINVILWIKIANFIGAFFARLRSPFRRKNKEQ